jgi:lamin tail-like protein
VQAPQSGYLHPVSNRAIPALAVVLGLGAWAATNSDQPEPSTANTGSDRVPSSSTTGTDRETASAPAAPDRVAEPIRITRVSYDPPGLDDGSNAHLNREWVAIKSFGQQPRQLKGWTLRDASGKVFRFPAYRLSPNETVVVHPGDGWGARHDLYWGMEYPVWNDTGDTVTLRHRDGRLVDRCHWNAGDGMAKC